MSKIVWRYYLRFRPPMPGAIPKNGIDRVVSFDWPQSFDGVSSWGYVEYTRCLTDKEIDDYELVGSKNNPLEY